METVRARLPIEPDSKWFIEVNPEDVDVARARSWQGLGFTNVSLGVQSFRADELRRLGRRHDREQARQAVEICLNGGFDTVSIDLMFGLPGQTPAAWRESLDLAIALAPQHLSCYQLSVHEGTTFGRWRDRGKLTEMPETEQADLFELTHRRLSSSGWLAYEVSNFAVSTQHQSRHNKKYWQHAPYLGLGPSSHSFDGRRRWWNERDLGRYRRKVANRHKPIADGEILSREELALEALLLGLRTTEGIALEVFSRKYGIDLGGSNAALIDTLAAERLLEVRNGRLCPTLAGLAVADGLAGRFRLNLGDFSP
jgi:oxygen-independent coproporphyrinogen-3 oxidase